MNITEFLLARIAEDEVQITEWDRSSPFSTERLFAECAAKRAILATVGGWQQNQNREANEVPEHTKPHFNQDDHTPYESSNTKENK